jgi:hypothetical protein
MTRKHFRDLAVATGTACALDGAVRESMTAALVIVCQRHNAAFNRQTFREAVEMAAAAFCEQEQVELSPLPVSEFDETALKVASRVYRQG